MERDRCMRLISAIQGLNNGIFLDTAEVDPIKELASTGLLDGVTINPTLIAKSGRDFKQVITEICNLGIVKLLAPAAVEGNSLLLPRF